MTLKTRIAEVRALADVKVPHSPDAIPNCHGKNFKPAVAIINELTNKLDIARKALEPFASIADQFDNLPSEAKDNVEAFNGLIKHCRIAKQALKLTDIEQEQPE